MFAQRDAGNKHDKEDEQESDRKPLFDAWLQSFAGLGEVDQKIGQKSGAVAVAGRIGVAGLDETGGEIEVEVVTEEKTGGTGMEKKYFAQEFKANAQKEDR